MRYCWGHHLPPPRLDQRVSTNRRLNSQRVRFVYANTNNRNYPHIDTAAQQTSNSILLQHCFRSRQKPSWWRQSNIPKLPTGQHYTQYRCLGKVPTTDNQSHTIPYVVLVLDDGMRDLMKVSEKQLNMLIWVADSLVDVARGLRVLWQSLGRVVIEQRFHW